MAKKALRLWMELPSDIRNKILSNVWCPGCRTAVAICDYSADIDGGVVVLRGFCGTCGHKVARVLEDCSKNSKKLRKCTLGSYIFNVWLHGDERCSDDKRIIRKIQIAGTKSLYNFAEVLTNAFDFHFDHCFGFYERREGHFFSGKAFELFMDIGEDPTVAGARGVKKTKIKQAFKSPGEKMIFLFDYGDAWQFEVELKEIKPSEKGNLKSMVLEKVGEAHLQYPPCEDEVEDE